MRTTDRSLGSSTDSSHSSNLEEVSRALPESALPSDGHLWFFQRFDATDGRPSHGELVLYRPKETPLVRAEFGAKPATAECALTFEVYEDLPDPSGETRFGATWDELARDCYVEVRGYLNRDGDRPAHKLLGHAEPEQDPMERECVLASHDPDSFTGMARNDPRAEAILAQASEWRLLLQVASDPNADMRLWGKLYYWIREEDLRARRFDRVLLIEQGG